MQSDLQVSEKIVGRKYREVDNIEYHTAIIDLKNYPSIFCWKQLGLMV